MEEFKFDLNNYIYEIIDNILIINKQDLINYDLTNSKILDIKFNNENYPVTYRGIICKLLCEFTAKELKQISINKYRIKDGEYSEKGYYYIEKINISYPPLCSNECIREILNLIDNLKNKDFYIKIKLQNNLIIFVSIIYK